MTFFRTSLIVLAAFGCGAVSAAVFVSRPIPAPDDMPSAAAPAPVAVAPAPARVQQPAPKPEPRIVTVDKPVGQESATPEPATQQPATQEPASRDPQTTGTAGSVSAPRPAAIPNADRQLSATNSCNQAACGRAYRSFDSSTCTYQPTHGGPRRQCEK
jgi:hypothetical protein